jgi:selenium metabolism protein YedF
MMQSKVFLIQSEGLGKGDDRLGMLLMANFLRLLGEGTVKPAKILFWNAGVKLVCEGSQVLDHIKRLEQQGVELLACTTCLEYFDLKEKMKAGKFNTMIKSIESLMNEDTIVL